MTNLELPTRPPVIRRKKAGGERNGRFVKGGEPGPGRPRAGHDKYTREIKQALLDAVEYVGEEKAAEFLAAGGELDGADANLPRGISAYLVWISRDYPQVACAMLSRMMPQQTEATHKVEHTYHSLEEIGNRLRELELPAQHLSVALLAHQQLTRRQNVFEVCHRFLKPVVCGGRLPIARCACIAKAARDCASECYSVIRAETDKLMGAANSQSEPGA
jgi:hypothetical protein